MYKKAVFLFLSFTLVFTSCRKGDEDPFLSLSSRKARLSGEWVMSDIFYSEARYVNGIQDGTIYSEQGNSQVISGMELYEFDTIHFDKDITTYSLQIDKDGTWEKVIDYQISSVHPGLDEGESTRYTHDILYTEKGTWSFMNKIKDVTKNKERVHLSLLNKAYDHRGGTQTTTFADGTTFTTEIPPSVKDEYNYAEGEESIIYNIVMLKSKEMKWEREHSSENTVSFETNLDPTYNTTFELVEKIRWVAN